MAVAILINFGAHVNILFIIKVRILELIKWPPPPPPIMLTIEPRMVNKFEYVIKSFLNTCLFGVCS